MILQHYIKIAFRNLAKYKVQSAISIVGLAIGLICFTYGWNELRRVLSTIRTNLPNIRNR